MERKRTYKSKSGAEYELVQVTQPTPKRAKKKKQSTISKLLSLSSEDRELFNKLWADGMPTEEALRHVRSGKAKKRTAKASRSKKATVSKKPVVKQSKAQKTKARKSSVNRARKSTAKRKKTPAKKKKAKQQLSMF